MVEYGQLPWTWEVNANASDLLGFPVASDFSVERMEAQIQGRVETSIAKLQQRHLSLAGRVTAANCLILGTIWYLITLWAGDLGFLAKLQKAVDAYVWPGKSRVNSKATTQEKHQGGLGLILITEQYNAIAGNIMLWVLGPERHPLRLILASHLRDLSRRQGGYPDYLWVVIKGGSKQSRGCTVWQNICLAWHSLKPMLEPTQPQGVGQPPTLDPTPQPYPTGKSKM